MFNNKKKLLIILKQEKKIFFVSKPGKDYCQYGVVVDWWPKLMTPGRSYYIVGEEKKGREAVN